MKKGKKKEKRNKNIVFVKAFGAENSVNVCNRRGGKATGTEKRNNYCLKWGNSLINFVHILRYVRKFSECFLSLFNVYLFATSSGDIRL